MRNWILSVEVVFTLKIKIGKHFELNFNFNSYYLTLGYGVGGIEMQVHFATLTVSRSVIRQSDSFLLSVFKYLMLFALI